MCDLPLPGQNERLKKEASILAARFAPAGVNRTPTIPGRRRIAGLESDLPQSDLSRIRPANIRAG